jgi:hypothetical protein
MFVFVIANVLSVNENLGEVAHGLTFILSVHAYFRLWLLGQVLWNLRYRKPIPCTLLLVSQKDSGFDRSTSVFLAELGLKAVFGRTSMAWTPTPFLTRSSVYVFPGRYAVIVADGSPPVASTLRV